MVPTKGSPNLAATEPVDLTNCDREPIHLLGAIQPNGFLIALTSDWMIARASANLAAFIHVEPSEAIGRPLTDVFHVVRRP